MPLKIICIIPARGGSKGIPNKNIQPVLGKPLIAHSIEQALNTKLVERIIVSTDDQKIASIAKQYGAEIIWRPSVISGDTATSESALSHALNHLFFLENYAPDLVVFLQATSPLRNKSDIHNAIETFVQEDADSLFSACLVQGFIWEKNGNKISSLNYDFKSRKRRQDCSETLMENGSIYIFKPWVLSKFGNRLGGKISFYVMDPLKSFQIDEYSDLHLIERANAGEDLEYPSLSVSGKNNYLHLKPSRVDKHNQVAA